jgi:hypothetical protein
MFEVGDFGEPGAGGKGGGKAQGANALMLWVPRNRSSAPRALPLPVGLST